ncbi:DUF6273 domain-containing protein [Collinsella sp. AF38-3AC]|uniref:DUF6273 domain-containing protein n=1 Tax=Collinsella sp. AF38-3AC TaxID=2292015 RepID=UPI000E5469EA|nr:DUF6273 domain-containing protein [Collinsella sp. AF38-3AC]RHL22661.1 hypothetical protein DW029_08420 [Collinsella sp. AF38-3AC]
MQRHFRHGGVSPRSARLRGQSIIEYVLIIAVIGLVIVFAGPGVAGAIRNQFNQVTNTVDSGADGGNFMSAEEKAYREAMKTVVNKDAKDWSLGEQKAAATDIAKNGTSSVVYAKAKAAMEAGTKFSAKLTNGKTLEYRIVGINHDDLADGSGKAGLTFEATNAVLGAQRMNATQTNAGGWEQSELRGRLNSGDLWSLLPSELQSKVKSVKKMTDNKGGGTAGTPSATTDKVFLLSTTEVYGNLQSDGAQYEYYKSKGVTTSSYSGASSSSNHWARSVSPGNSAYFRSVYSNGDYYYSDATYASYVFPAFSF